MGPKGPLWTGKISPNPSPPTGHSLGTDEATLSFPPPTMASKLSRNILSKLAPPPPHAPLPRPFFSPPSPDPVIVSPLFKTEQENKNFQKNLTPFCHRTLSSCHFLPQHKSLLQNMQWLV